MTAPLSSPHIPVMRDEVLAALSPADGEVYVDGTFGAGGYTSAILDAADCRVIAIDRDPSALEGGADLAARYGARLSLVHGCFGDVAALLRDEGEGAVNGFVLDIGVSSMQLDRAERGFSFRADGPLDMRMDPSSGGPSAADVVNTMPQADLADIIYKYGEERHSRRIAAAIVRARAEAPFAGTARLAETVRAAIPRAGKEALDPATRTFQALRIYVNDELGELQRALDAAPAILAENGRLVVVSFHSLEDGEVKRALRAYAGEQGRVSRHVPEAGPPPAPLFTLVSRKPVAPSDAETAANPRARSARLRAAIRTVAPLPAGGRS